MSIEALGYVFTLMLPANEKWLAVCLANHADKWGDSIFPSLDTLEVESGLSRSTIKRAFKELIKLGIVERSAKSTPVSPAFYCIGGVPEPHDPSKDPRSCPHALRRAVIHAFASRCEYCHEEGTRELGPDGRPWHVDRVVPHFRGGVYTPTNVTLACKTCNHKKKTKPAPDGTRTLTDIQQLVEGTVQSEPSPETDTAGSSVDGPRGLPERPGGSAWTDGPSTVNPEPLLESSFEPSLIRKAGAAPRLAFTAGKNGEELPASNISVITKLAHEVIEQLGANHEDLSEALKSRCATLHIPYDSNVVGKAIESAKWQREHRSEAS